MTDSEKPSEPVEPDEEPTKPAATSIPAGAITGAKITATSISSGKMSMAPTYWGTGGVISTTPKGPKMKVKDLPAKRPKTILIAFLDENDNQEWAAKLKAKEISIDLGFDGVPKMNLEVDLMVEDEE